MRLVLQIFLLTTELQINIIPFKVVPGKPHTAGDIAPTPSTSPTRSLHVEVPTAGL